MITIRIKSEQVYPILIWAMILSCGLTGCRSAPQRPEEPVEIKEPVYHYLPSAHVIRVNPNHNYVILSCTVLPRPGEQGKVYRENIQIAEIAVTPHKQGIYVTADILRGEPAKGDLVKFKQIVSQEKSEE